MSTLAEVWAGLPGLAQRGASGRLVIGPTNLQRADLDFNWNIVGHAILWVGVRPSVEPLADVVADFFHAIAKKPHRPREQNILRLYELVGIPVPEGRSPRSTEDEETWGNESLLVKRWMKKVKKNAQQRKRTLLQALETEVAYIEMLLKAKGDLAAKKAWNAAWQHSGAGQAVDRVDTCPMEAGLAEEVLEAARIEVHRREVEQSMQDESQREPALSAELRGTTLVLGQAPEDPEEPHPTSERMPDDDNATIFFDPETMACLEGTGGPGDEKPIPGFVGGGEPHHDKPAEKPEALVGSDEPNDDEPAALDGSGEADDDEPAALDGSGKADDDEPEALVGSGEADDDKSEALDGSGEPDFEPEEALFGSGEPDDDKSEALDGSGEPNDDKPDDDEALGGSGEADDDESEADDDESEPMDVSGEPDDAKPNASVGKGGPSPESSGSVQPPLPKPACAKDFTAVGPAQQHTGKKGGGRGKGAKQRPDEGKALTGKATRIKFCVWQAANSRLAQLQQQMMHGSADPVPAMLPGAPTVSSNSGEFVAGLAA
ncbi:hypothetical protein AK812_SmicGene25258, partial [Symbiodinium microadriaticum]